MLRMKIVIQKDRVVRTRAQQLLSLSDIVGDIDEVAFESPDEPLMPTNIIIQKKNTNRMSFGFDLYEANFRKDRVQQTHIEWKKYNTRSSTEKPE